MVSMNSGVRVEVDTHTKIRFGKQLTRYEKDARHLDA